MKVTVDRNTASIWYDLAIKALCGLNLRREQCMQILRSKEIRRRNFFRRLVPWLKPLPPDHPVAINYTDDWSKTAGTLRRLDCYQDTIERAVGQLSGLLTYPAHAKLVTLNQYELDVLHGVAKFYDEHSKEDECQS